MSNDAGRITRISDAPLPTPDPWAGDEPEQRRCPACALSEPGARHCRRCKAALTFQVRSTRPLSINLLNLGVVLIGMGPLLLAITFLYRADQAPLLNPWSLWLGAQIPLLGIAAGGLWLRWRWTWFLAFALAGANIVAMLTLQLLVGTSPVVPIAGLLTSLMIMGLLLNVYDEVRIDELPIELPPAEQLPPTPDAAFNLGVAYSKRGHWYLAARMWQRAAAREHHEGRYRRALGLAYLRLRELEAAQSELAAAAALMPDDAQTRELQAALRALRQPHES